MPQSKYLVLCVVVLLAAVTYWQHIMTTNSNPREFIFSYWRQLQFPKKAYTESECSTETRMSEAVSRMRERVKKVFTVKGDWKARWSALVSPSFPDFPCVRMSRWGSFHDGGWSVCLDGPYDITNMSKCLVYSFGLSSNWVWDFDVVLRTKCEVHGFDHTVDLSKENKSMSVPVQESPDSEKTLFLKSGPAGQRSLPHGSTYHFHKIGIAGDDRKGNVKSLPTLMKMIGNDGMVIDYLKIDVEGAEWNSLFNGNAFDILVSKTRQIGIELHPRVSNAEHLTITSKLFDAGFVIAATNANPWHPQLREVVFLNSKFASENLSL